MFSIKSINQTSIAPTSPAKPGSVAWQTNQCSTAKSRKQFCIINRPSGVTVSIGERPNQMRLCLQVFLEGSNWTRWTDRQWEVVPKRRGTRVKSSSTSILSWPQGLTNYYHCLISVNGKESMQPARKQDKQLFFHAGFRRSTNLS